jgi:hypothetical protein
MKIGDLVRASWSSALSPPERGRIPHVGVYLGRRGSPQSDTDIIIFAGEISVICDDGYHIILSDQDTVELPSWYWDVEVINESR